MIVNTEVVEVYTS